MEDLSEEEQVMMKQAELVLMSNALPGKGQRIFLVWANLNWGPPVGGRYDTDHFTIWAAVPRDVSVQQVCLHYTCDEQTWMDSRPFDPIERVENFFLYRLGFTGRYNHS
eukprot:TRINITY_DN1661_c0_g1_i2.p1 TRINITY_DN1661_c0_g1~~TRINITY_DN1661_c0_g1_i2.p1  ORF type:complete len:109 (+),score=24.05 TRINITY_DN1661_c0_g1_i2:173-499(+)